MLDESGVIMLVNRAWSDYASANGGDPGCGVAVGVNYLDVCRLASRSDAVARQALEGLKESVLSGARAHFAMEYPCDSPTRKSWFAISVDALDPEPPMGAIVSHQDISARKKAELALAESERRYRAVFDLAAVGIGNLRPTAAGCAPTARCCASPGARRKDLMSKTVRDITHAQDIDADAAYLEVLHAGARGVLRDGEAAGQAGRRFGLDGDRAPACVAKMRGRPPSLRWSMTFPTASSRRRAR